MAERDLVGAVVVTRYRVIAKVASGATADIYDAEHVTLKSHVALKVLANNDASSEVAARFLREGKTLGMFRHPNIVELLEVGRLADGRLFLATELVHGLSLRQLQQKGAVGPRRALEIMREVLDALGHAHGMGIIHRGMRPENVMVTDDGGVKVLDFGVAKLATDTAAVMGENKLTKTGIAVLGDPRYTAPEVAKGGEIDARAALYSVGAMLKELIKTPSNPQVQLVISDGTQANPDKRYRAAAEMRDAVDTAIASLDDAAAMSAGSGVVATAAPASTSAGWSLDSQPTTSAPPPTRPSAPFLPGVTERPSKPSVPPPVEAQPSAPQISADPLFTATPQVPTAPTTHTGPWHGEANLTASEASRPPGWTATPAPKQGAGKLVALAKQHRLIVGGVLGVIVLVIIIAIVAGGGSKKAKKTASGGDAKTIMKQGRDELEAGHRSDAMSLYERAIGLDSSRSEERRGGKECRSR